VTSDGVIDQNGGEQNMAFGKKRVSSMLTEICNKPMAEQQVHIENIIAQYMKDSAQRDYITIIGFKI
jgi:serine phosphatase RsbU (regulator of sigma subunit)